MDNNCGSAYLAAFFERARPRLGRLLGRLVEDPACAVDDAAGIFADMVPTLGYRDRPQHPFANALFTCSVNLAAFLACRKRGVDAHTFGTAMLRGLAKAPVPPPTIPDNEADVAGFTAFLAANEPGPGEDVFEVVPSEASFVFGYNITSCAICHTAAAHDASELVPYFCAVDDLMSDKGKAGLRRTGSLALGADCCDFRYRPGGHPQPLAPQFPQQIRV